MNKTNEPNKQENKTRSRLEEFKLFFEHTDDSRVVVNNQAKPVKRPSRNLASKR